MTDPALDYLSVEDLLEIAVGVDGEMDGPDITAVLERYAHDHQLV